MARFKVYDIQPPKQGELKAAPIKRDRKISIIIRRISFLIVFFVLIFLIMTQFLNANSAEIEIYPETEEMNFQAFLTADSEIEEMDFMNQIIPGYPLEKEVALTKEFIPSRVQLDKKAFGTIRVYNKYDSPVTLIANTRFLSSTESTKLFLAKKKFTVPAGGYTDVEVVASEPGDDYNIEPCSFSIPGLRNFSPPELYYNVYGKSFSRMQGGDISEAFKVTEEDLEEAEKTLKEEAEREVLKALREFAGEEYVVLDKTIETEIIESNPVDATVNQIKDNFLYQIKIKSEVFTVKNSDIRDFVIQYIGSKIPPDKAVYADSAEVESIVGNIDIEGVSTIDISFKGDIYSKIDTLSIRDISRNQQISNIKRYISEIYPEISKPPKIRLNPFFFRKAPKDINSINILIKFD